MKYFFPIHLDGGNRGCEAIARGSAMLLGEHPDHLLGYCRDVELDTRLGLNKSLTLMACRRESFILDRLLALLSRLLPTSRTVEWHQTYPFRTMLRMVGEDDVVLFTGGDMLCYGNNELIYLNNWLHRRGIKTVLWGCSMGPENQTKEKRETLSRFSLIYTRESMTYDYFMSLGLQNVCLFPDPAFVLEAQQCPLPDFLQKGDVVGLNVSNYVMGGMTLDGQFAKEVLDLISYILTKTNQQLMLIPHVTWKVGGENQDDREMAKLISEHYAGHERLHILDIDQLNYCQIRHAISKCSMFVGARTHAVISAYSMCVPTIALGYSIKSRGIAKDLGLDERLVVNSKDFAEGDLLRSFLYLAENKEAIREHLQTIMPEYKQRTYQIRERLAQLK